MDAEGSTLIADLPLLNAKESLSHPLQTPTDLSTPLVNPEKLPSRDIPVSESITAIQIDPKIKANYIQPRESFLHVNEDSDDQIRERNAKRRRIRIADDLLVAVQRPILLALLFFLFQLPIFRNYLTRYASFSGLTTPEGHLSVSGMTMFSMLFGVCVYGLQTLSDSV